MTATDELWRLLDECGVEYKSHYLYTSWYADMRLHVAKDNMNGTLTVDNLTPEQAIAATLGSHERTCKLDGFADVRFSVDYEVEGYAVGSSSDYATLEECSSCGAYVIEPPAFHHVLTCDGDEIYQPYNYCPNCGAHVERSCDDRDR